MIASEGSDVFSRLLEQLDARCQPTTAHNLKIVVDNYFSKLTHPELILHYVYNSR